MPSSERTNPTMARFRPEMTKYYYDPTKYKSYLEQLGIKYPVVKSSSQH